MIASKGYTPTDPSYAALALGLHEWTKLLNDQVVRAKYADRLAKALLVGKAFADQYTKTKHILGVVDFDDMIRKTAELLGTGHMAAMASIPPAPARYSRSATLNKQSMAFRVLHPNDTAKQGRHLLNVLRLSNSNWKASRFRKASVRPRRYSISSTL